MDMRWTDQKFREGKVEYHLKGKDGSVRGFLNASNRRVVMTDSALLSLTGTSNPRKITYLFEWHDYQELNVRSESRRPPVSVRSRESQTTHTTTKTTSSGSNKRISKEGCDKPKTPGSPPTRGYADKFSSGSLSVSSSSEDEQIPNKMPKVFPPKSMPMLAGESNGKKRNKESSLSQSLFDSNAYKKAK